MSDNLSDELSGLWPSRISNILDKAVRHRKKCYIARRQWQLKQFYIGYRTDWSHHELLLALKNRRNTLRQLQNQNPGATGTLLLPMMSAAYDVEIAANHSCNQNSILVSS